MSTVFIPAVLRSNVGGVIFASAFIVGSGLISHMLPAAITRTSRPITVM